MAHWRSLLPADVMLEVQYGTLLVQDFEPQARRLVAHCGIAWDPASLDFHKTPRAELQTASMNPGATANLQSSIGRWRPDPALLEAAAGRLGDGGGVRTSGESERWRRYEPWLGELRQLMLAGRGQRRLA